MAGADGKGPASGGDPRVEEARAALVESLVRQQKIAEGLRVVNTQGRESIALADSKYQTVEDDEVLGWMA